MTRLVLAFAFLAWVHTARAQTPRGNDDFDSVRFSQKVIGGETAAPGSFAWQVSLQRADMKDPRDAHFCGGSIRAAKWIVTAAHCMVNLDPADVQVVAGTQTLTSQTKRLKVRRIFVDPRYDRASHNYDVALIMLDQPLSLGAGSQAIRPVSPNPADATPLYVTGWGATSEGGGSVRTLRFVQVPLVNVADCRSPFSYGERISDLMLCAGDAQGGHDACQGDSGGPLSTASKGAGARLVGIVSWGDGCGRPGKPGVYTKVTSVQNWIDRRIAEQKE